MIFKFQQFYQYKVYVLFLNLFFHNLIFTQGFVVGTNIVMSNGSLVPIEKIKVGSEIVTINVETGDLRTDYVYKVTHSKEKSCIKINFGEKAIYCSRNQRFLVDKQWTKAEDIQSGDHVYSYSIGWEPYSIVTEVSVVDSEDLLVINLVVPISQNYFASSDMVLTQSYSYIGIGGSSTSREVQEHFWGPQPEEKEEECEHNKPSSSTSSSTSTSSPTASTSTEEEVLPTIKPDSIARIKGLLDKFKKKFS